MARGEAATMIKIHKTFESTYACWWGLTEFVWTSTIQWKYITIHGILNFSSIYIKKEKANRETGELIFIEKNSHVIETTQFKPMLIKGQLNLLRLN